MGDYCEGFGGDEATTGYQDRSAESTVDPKDSIIQCIQSVNDTFDVIKGPKTISTKESSKKWRTEGRYRRQVSGVPTVLLTQRSKDEIEVATGQRWSPASIEFPQIKPVLTDFQCAHHPTEPVRFFCLQCKVPCFCGCCCVDNLHRGHDVMIIPDAWRHVRDSHLEKDVIQRLQQYVDNTYRVEVELRDRRQHSLNATNETKQLLEQALSRLVETMQESEKTTLTELRNTVSMCEDQLEKHLKDVDDYGSILRDLERQLSLVKSTRDPVTVCRMYEEILRGSLTNASPTLEAVYEAHFAEDYPNGFQRTAGWYREQLNYLAETKHTQLTVLDQLSHILQHTSFTTLTEKGLSEVPIISSEQWNTLLENIKTLATAKMPSNQSTQTSELARHIEYWKQQASNAKKSLVRLRLPVAQDVPFQYVTP